MYSKWKPEPSLTPKVRTGLPLREWILGVGLIVITARFLSVFTWYEAKAPSHRTSQNPIAVVRFWGEIEKPGRYGIRKGQPREEVLSALPLTGLADGDRCRLRKRVDRPQSVRIPKKLKKAQNRLAGNSGVC